MAVPVAEPAPAPAPVPVAAPAAPAAASGEHPLAITNSPWSQETKPDPDLLPSADVLPSALVPASPPVAEPLPVSSVAPPQRSNRVLMTVGLAVAVVALIATVVLLTMSSKSGPDDPANVKVGAEQRDYADDPTPTAAPSKATAAPVKRPVVIPKPVAPKTTAKPKKPEDIYEDL